MRGRPLLIAVLALTLPVGAALAQAVRPPAPGAAPQIGTDRARAIARDAYVFAYPLVLYYRTMYRQAIDAKSPNYTGGFGRWGHRAEASPRAQEIVSPNVDTPYSFAWVDLRAEPWVLTQPASDGRYVASQWDDLWGFVLDCPGSVEDGDGGGNYLLVPPGWKGVLPPGIKRTIDGESSFLGTSTRTELRGPGDAEAVAKLQRGYRLQPLSAFLKQPPPVPPPAIEWPPWQDGAETDLRFFSYANFLLPFTTPNRRDAAILARIAQIGVVPGARWDTAQMDPKMQDAIAAGIAGARGEMRTASLKLKDSLGLFGNRQALGSDYLKRAIGVAGGMFGADPRQAIYYPFATDAAGSPADAARHDYTLTLPPGGLPPAHYFWSVTMYGLPGHNLVANPLRRYALGSRKPQPRAARDGSVTLYLQHDPPPERRANWLPAPDGPFYALLRVYGPSRDEISGLWKPPRLEIAR